MHDIKFIMFTILGIQFYSIMCVHTAFTAIIIYFENFVGSDRVVHLAHPSAGIPYGCQIMY